MDRKEEAAYLKELKNRFKEFSFRISCSLWVDMETGVEYLQSPDGHFLPLLDPDGKPSINQKYKDGLL